MNIKTENEKMYAAYHAAGHKGDDIVVGLFGSGVNPLKTLKSNVLAGNALGLNDKNDHETSVAYLIREGLPNAQIISYNVFPDGKDGSIFALKDAMRDFLKSAKADTKRLYIANMSFSGSDLNDAEFRALGVELLNAGVATICSVGNSGKDVTGKDFPAGDEWPYTVTAVTRTGKLTDFSSMSETADFCEWGEDVLVMRASGAFSLRDGSSLSGPILLTKMGELQSCYHDQTGRWFADAEIYALMCSLTKDLGEDGHDTSYGWGFVDIGNPIKYEASVEPEDPEESVEPANPEEPEKEEPALSAAQQFYEKARQCVGGLYVWGGQGHIATEAWLRKKAKDDPDYFTNGRLEMMIARVKADPTLRAWDCSGLVNWALAEIGAMPTGFDTTAQGLYANYCDKITQAELQTGDLLFRYSSDDKKMVHVGIYALDASVEAAGGAYGVVECKGLKGTDHAAKSYVDCKTYQLPNWTHFGRLKVLAVETPAPTTVDDFAYASGDVNIRKGPGTTYGILGVAKKGVKLHVMQAVNGWRQASARVGDGLVLGYISDKYIKEA